MKLPPALQKKGICTVALVVATECMTFSKAVHFWSTYQSWSNRYGNGRRNFSRDNGNHKSSYNHDNENEKNDSHHRHEDMDRGFFDLFSRKSKAASPTLSQIHECASEQTCTASKLRDQGSHALHPRKLTRMVNVAHKTTSCPNHSFYECCRTNAPSCMTLLDIRGGGLEGSANLASDTISTAATAAETILVAAHSTGLPTPYNLSLNLWKVIFQIFLTAMNVACWLIPLRAKKMTENKLALGIANAFSGGVFLSLAFGHLIPECVHGFEGMNEVLPYMIVLGGYLLIFFVEKVAFDAHGLMHECGADHGIHGGENKEIITSGSNGSAVSTSSVSKDGNGGAGTGTGRSAVILLGALAVHSILEMAALGLARSFGDSALLTLSIALHQPAESIALLVAFLKSGMPKNEIFKYLSVFSMMGPIGVGIGMAVNEFASPLIDSIMLATVAGTFVYVGATEVIPEEWEEQDHKWKKFFALMGGIISIFGITQYTMSLEGHSH